MTNTSLYAVRDTGGEVTKVDIITGAYSQLRISGITRSPTPEDLELALTRLEDMAAEWDTTGKSVGWNFEENPDPNSHSGIIRGFKSAFETNLAVRLIPDFNKQVPPTLMQQAAQSLSNLTGRAAANRVRGVDYSQRMPIGSGNSIRCSRWARFYSGAGQAPLSSTSDSMFVGDVRDYTEHYETYLTDGETIDSFSIVVDPTVTLDSSAIDGDDINYRLTAASSTVGNVAQVTVIMTTSTGRVETRRRFIETQPTGA